MTAQSIQTTVAGTPIALILYGCPIPHISVADVATLSGRTIAQVKQWSHDTLKVLHKAEGFKPPTCSVESMDEIPLDFAALLMEEIYQPDAAREIERIDEAFMKCPLMDWVSRDDETKRLAAKFYAAIPGVLPRDVFEGIGRLARSLKSPLTDIDFVDGKFVAANGSECAPIIETRWTGCR